MNRAFNGLLGAVTLLVVIGIGWTVYRTMLARQVIPGIGGPFALIDGAGHARTDKDFAGKWMLIYFGYTHCPDTCPTTLNTMAQAMDDLPAARKSNIVPLFITIDPERDTPAIMKTYAESFGPQFIGLTGSPAAIQKAEDAYRVYAAKHPLKDGDYDMDHSSVIYVMGPDGRYRANIADDMKPDELAKQLDRLMAG